MTTTTKPNLFRWRSKKTGERMIKIRVEHTLTESDAALAMATKVYDGDDVPTTPTGVRTLLREALSSPSGIAVLWGCDGLDDEGQEALKKLATALAKLA